VDPAAKPTSARSILSVPVRRFSLASGQTVCDTEQDLLAVEEPLQIQLGERNLAITMRTPGHDAELAAGFLFTEGFIQRRSDIASIECAGNIAKVYLHPSVDLDSTAAGRNFYITSSCGICGKASIEALENAGCRTLPQGAPLIDQSVIRCLPEKLRQAQVVFDRTGGLHASGLVSSKGEMVLVREDVGRHNAVDKLIGRALLDDQVPLHDYILVLSGRTSFELLQKAVMAGIPVLAAVGAPSSLAVKTALRFGVTLIGFLRENRFNVYSAPGRISGWELEASTQPA
jgi:FdhD protein